MSEHISRADFESAVSGAFAVTGAELEITLDQVEDGIAPRDDYECFSLKFSGPKDKVVMDQGTFELTHEKLGAVSIFMVPIGEDETNRIYQAVFNRPKK